VNATPGKDWVLIGRLIRVRGNRGELVGELDSAEPGREDRLSEVRLERGDRNTVVRVEQVWRNPSIYDGRPVFKFEGIDSISAAEPWEGAGICVPAEEVAKPEEGAYSFAELIGCEVLQHGGEGGAGRIGVVEAIEEYGGPPLLRVRSAGSREILIPFARSICKRIDPEAKIIAVELPEGLLDL
jgi:16S rRNA processing protein RimM